MHPVMIPAQLFDEVASRISQLASSGPAADLERNARAVLTGLLGRLDLVTREEFEIQRALLLRAQDQLRALETRINQLEQSTAAKTAQ